MTRAEGHPQWDSVFGSWEPLPPPEDGTLAATTTDIANASTQKTIGLIYTAPAGGLDDGVLTIAVPPGWTAPVTSASIGCTVSTAGRLATSGQTITVSSLTLPPHGQLVVTYGAIAGGACVAGDGATASSTPGAPVWQGVIEASGKGPASLESSPSINVDASDGSGTLTIQPGVIAAGSAGTTLTFTYTAAGGGLNDGTATITLPAGWTAPVTTDAPGCTASSVGTVTTSGQTIVVSGLTLAANTSAVISYGANSRGSCTAGDGAVAPLIAGPSTFTGEEMSTVDGVLTPLATAPALSVN